MLLSTASGDVQYDQHDNDSKGEDQVGQIHWRRLVEGVGDG